jgi:hypothetical protein
MKMNAHQAIGGVAVGGIATLAFAFSPIDRAQAATITSLYNTGVDASKVVMPDQSFNDTHYTLTSVPGGTTTTVVRRAAGGYPIAPGPYVGDNNLSAWIGPGNTYNFDGVPGNYVYRTTFSLTGLVASTAQITGKWATDNTGVDIRLNGTSLGISQSNADLYDFVGFSIAAGSPFVAGTNTLEFIVNNSLYPGNNPPTHPTALRVELTGTANSISTAVPEPSDLVGTALAVGSVVFLKRNLTKKARISK